MTHVPYRGTLPSLNDVIAGHIQLMFSDLAPAYPLIQAGKLRALGITTAQRAASAPGVRPLAEVGVPGFDWAAWQSVAVPTATPKDITRQAQRRDQRGDRRARRHQAAQRPAVHPGRQRHARRPRPVRESGERALGQGADAGRCRGDRERHFVGCGIKRLSQDDRRSRADDWSRRRFVQYSMPSLNAISPNSVW